MFSPRAITAYMCWGPVLGARVHTLPINSNGPSNCSREGEEEKAGVAGTSSSDAGPSYAQGGLATHSACRPQPN